jgi:hypothetical protein
MGGKKDPKQLESITSMHLFFMRLLLESYVTIVWSGKRGPFKDSLTKDKKCDAVILDTDWPKLQWTRLLGHIRITLWFSWDQKKESSWSSWPG